MLVFGKDQVQNIMFLISSCTTCFYAYFIVDIKLLAKNQSNESTDTQECSIENKMWYNYAIQTRTLNKLSCNAII